MSEIKKKQAKKQVKEIFPNPDYYGELIGYETDDMEDGWVRTSLHIKQKHLSLAGVTHGGAISAFADFSMGGAVISTLSRGERCSTIEFKINYLSPVKEDETIYCDARVKYRGRSHAVVEFHIFREEGKDVAVGVGTFNIYS